MKELAEFESKAKALTALALIAGEVKAVYDTAQDCYRYKRDGVERTLRLVEDREDPRRPIYRIMLELEG